MKRQPRRYYALPKELVIFSVSNSFGRRVADAAGLWDHAQDVGDAAGGSGMNFSSGEPLLAVLVRRLESPSPAMAF